MPGMAPAAADGWDGLDPGAGGDGRPAAPADADGETALLFARVFRGEDGARALAHLRAMTLDRALGPEASPEALRHLEGQRCLIRHLLALVTRGRRGG